MDKIRVLFVLPEHCTDQNQASDIMLEAYESCKQNVVNVSWVQEEKFDSIDLSKTDFVIFQEFKGKHFESLSQSKCARILGPWCVLICLMEGRPIPNFTWPIYNVAMSGCVVSCSHLPKAKKMEIKEKVQLMGGCYSDNLMSTNTHLITESVKSEKYLQAAESGVRLMVSQWVNAVWDASQNKNIHCNDEEFNKYKCLPFHNLTVSSTGLPNIEMRNKLAQIVAKNGGVFTANLNVATTDVLIVYGVKGSLSQKYKAARNNPNTYCVTIEWIHDSVEKGYALPQNLYTVKKGTSTPTKADEPCPDFSIISAIGDCDRQQKTTLEETIASNSPGSFAVPKRISPQKRKCSNNEDVAQLIDGLDIKKAKMAGQYLDGCSVYVAGFKPEQREKLCKILNLSGATRYDDISDRLTHIIIGDPSCPEVKIIKSKNYPVSLVSIRWLLDSMDKQQAIDEENYLITLHDSEKEQFSSPLGRKGLSLLRSNKTLMSSDLKNGDDSSKTLQEPELEKDLMLQYRKTASRDDENDTLMQLINADSKFNSGTNTSEENKETSADNDSFSQRSVLEDKSSQPNNIFYSKKFLITHFDTEESQYIQEQIESVFGTVMSKTYKGIPDYVVAPTFITSPIQISALEVVNKLWILESIQECEEQPISYYHQPLVITNKKPLGNCVVTISGYTTYERTFLKELIEALGGTSQEQFARIMSAEKGVKASTHLVSLEADGKKYKAALKWGLPVVNKDWLFQCAVTGTLLPEDDFLMGEAKPSDKSKVKDVESKTPTPQAEKNKRILTPMNQKQPLDICKTEQTPLSQRLFKGVVDTPDPYSQVTPVNKLMEEVRRTNLLGTPQTPPLPKSWYLVNTPESPFGAAIKSHMSPKSKKELQRYIDCIPDFVPPPEGRKSTPLSEVKRRCWKKLLGQRTPGSPSCFPENRTDPSTSDRLEYDEKTNNDDQNRNGEHDENEDNENHSETSDQNLFLTTKFQQIQDMVSAMGDNHRRSSKAFQSTVPTEVGSSDVKDTQPFTVGWDYNEDTSQKSQIRIFILSGVENDVRQDIVAQIESLGGQVSELSSYDPKCTHLICSKPARNEKALACMAAGKWILHISYVEKSVAAGKFLDEEYFEFGNPKSKDNVKINFDKETEHRLQSMYWWRKEIAKRGYGAFNDMRAIVVAQKREPLVRVIEAGGGQVVNAEPPFKETVHATHCLLEVRSVPDFNVYSPLAQQGILCINTLYISDYLYRTNRDIKEAVLPHFSRFYS